MNGAVFTEWDTIQQWKLKKLQLDATVSVNLGTLSLSGKKSNHRRLKMVYIKMHNIFFRYIYIWNMAHFYKARK